MQIVMAESIKVILRVRPLNAREMNVGSSQILQFPRQNTVAIQNKSYNFDAVIPPISTQEDVYNVAGKDVVNNVIAGYNGTVFAYGQTSSGKTYTVVGKSGDSKLKGLIPRIVGAIFDYIMKKASNTTFLVKVSYLEIYMEKVRDLLDINKDNLPLFEDAKKTTYVKGATERYVSSPEEIFDILEEGRSNRKVAVTAMNLDSSRSHSIFSLTLHQEDVKSLKTLQSRLYLVDLAGSEKVSKSSAEGHILDEAKGINRSLSALGNVINALTEGVGHVPYRDSKLTRILQDSLGGNSKTTMIICCSPAEFNESETKSTLLFGMRAKSIKNVVTVNIELSAEEWKKNYLELKRRYEELAHQYRVVEREVKRWRRGDNVPDSDWAKEYNPSSIKTSSVIQEVENNAKQCWFRTAKERTSHISEVYQALDSKEEELAAITNEMNKLMNENTTVTLKLKKATGDKEKIRVENEDLKSKLETKEKELKEVLSSLEEVTGNLENIQKEILVNRDELLKQDEERSKAVMEIKGLQATLADTKMNEERLKNSLLTDVTKMKTELGEIISSLSDSKGIPKTTNSTKTLEDEFNNLFIYISKLKRDTQNFVNQSRNGIEGNESEKYKKIELLEKKVESVTRNYEDRLFKQLIEQRNLENELSILKKENIQMKADLIGSKTKVSEKIQSQLKQIIDQYTGDIKEARLNIEMKNEEILELKNKLEVAQAEVTILNRPPVKESENSPTREAAKSNIRNLEENVYKEFGELHNLQEMFLAELRNRVKKMVSRPGSRNLVLGEEDDLISTGEKLSPQQRERIAFLESNLDSLTKVHKQLVRENAELRSELPMLQKRVRAGNERVKQLEGALKDNKESALVDRKQYYNDIERLKDSFRGKETLFKSAIARPIKGGGSEG